jgi:hypothetical protein
VGEGGPSQPSRLLLDHDIILTILHAVEIVLAVRLAHREGVVPCLLNAPGHCSEKVHVRSIWTRE